MKSLATKTSVVMLTVLGTCLGSQAYAGCSPFDSQSSPPTAPQAAPQAPPAVGLPIKGFSGVAFVQTHGRDDDFGPGWPWEMPSIVGLWKIQFISKGNPGIPEDKVLDDGYATWHADGTELMNSSRPPITSSFCMGVWKKTGRNTYQLNHFALSWDDTGTTFVGPTNIRETVTVSERGNAYEGVFAITQYSIDGTTVLGKVGGIVKATRINP
jgi:hypothetical protein